MICISSREISGSRFIVYVAALNSLVQRSGEEVAIEEALFAPRVVIKQTLVKRLLVCLRSKQANKRMNLDQASKR